MNRTVFLFVTGARVKTIPKHAGLPNPNISNHSILSRSPQKYPKGHWDKLSNQKIFLNDLASRLNIKDKSGWYKMTVKSFQQHGAAGLLEKYGNSPSKLLSTVFPEYLVQVYSFIIIKYEWDLSKFPSLPRGYWNAVSNQRAFMDDLAMKLNISDTPGWLNVTARSLQHQGGATLLDKYHGSLSKLLSTVYPEYKQICRDLMVKMSHDLKLQDVSHIPVAYLVLGIQSVYMLLHQTLCSSTTSPA